uniref:Uncharacterized protein n=2 Tax=Populus trichocarpa TaxID=3694 RepID=A0A2K1X638_POPTR
MLFCCILSCFSFSVSQVEKRVYVALHVGDVIRFGHSSQLYIFQGPSDLMPLDDGDEVAWHTYKGQLTEKQEKTRDKIIKRRKKHFIIAAFVAHFLIFLSVLNKTVQLGKELSSLQSELGRILFLLKIADPSAEADQKRDSQVKDKKPDKAEVPVSATKKQPPTHGTTEK